MNADVTAIVDPSHSRTPSAAPAAPASTRIIATRRWLWAICAVHLLLSAFFAATNFDGDEFAFVPESYLILGGDYTAGYLKEGDVASAVSVAARSYYFFWKYRPLNAPLIDPADKNLFAAEEARFGYRKPGTLQSGEHDSLDGYKRRLIVPEPDRLYHHGAGKPLLSAVASIPQFVLVKWALPAGRTLLDYQFGYNYHAIFVLSRLAQIAAGLATVLLTFIAVRHSASSSRALLAASIVALCPVAIKYFPNIHHDALLAPFAIACAYFFSQRRYRLAGLWLGFALASKNSAIFLLAVLALYTALEALKADSVAPDPEGGSFAQLARGLLVSALIALAVLIPFANPLSYAQEILTPITHRAYDTRGENVAGFTLSGQYQSSSTDTQASPSSAVRPSVALAHRVARMDSVDFLFIAFAFLVLLHLGRHSLSRIAALMLLFALPVHALVFGYAFTYRYLVFLPFFAIVCAERIGARRIVALLAVFLVIDVLYCLDPISTGTSHSMRATPGSQQPATQ